MAMAVVDLGSRRRTLLFLRADQLAPLRVVPGVPAARPLHHRGAAGDAGHPGPRAGRRQHRLRRAGQRITLGSSAFHGAAARGLASAGLDVSLDNETRIQNLLTEAARTWGDRLLGAVKTGSIDQAEAEHYAAAFPEVYKQAVAPAGRDQRHRDHRRAAGQFGQTGARRRRRRRGRAAHLVPGRAVGVAEPAAADAAVAWAWWCSRSGRSR